MSKEQERCLDYISECAATEALLSGSLIKGTLYVDRFPSRGIVVTNEGREFEISGNLNFNRAYHLDIVLVEILINCNSRNDQTSFGKIVYILQKQPVKQLIGAVYGNMLVPLNSHYPRLRLAKNINPKEFKNRFILVSTEEKWSRSSNNPFCKIVHEIGPVEQFQHQYDAIIHKHEIKESFTGEQVWEILPPSWKIPQTEIAKRRDLRSELIFSIDPLDAKDLDDALSCIKLDSGNLLIGIHIADASFFVPYNSPLDIEARKRSTTFYLPTEKFPMLPQALSENLCSLKEKEDRLAVSIQLEITKDGDIVNRDFFRSVICSKKHIDYDTANKLINNEQILDSSVMQFSEPLKMLYNMSHAIRDKRNRAGALSIPSCNIKLEFTENRCVSVHEQEKLDSNALVEEYMLLANIEVAYKLVESIGGGVLVRSRSNPSNEKLQAFADQCNLAGLKLDVTNSITIRESLESFQQENSDGLLEKAIFHLASRSFSPAVFDCTEKDTSVDSKEYWHYNINVPFYGQFTSPIRRYADLMTHRQLVEVIEGKEQYITVTQMKHIAKTCNRMRKSASAANRECERLFLAELFRSTKKLVTEGIVVDISSSNVKLLVPDIDQNKFMSLGRNTEMKWNEVDQSLRFCASGSDDWLSVKMFSKVKIEASPRIYNSQWIIDLCVLFPPKGNQHLVVLREKEYSTPQTSNQTSKIVTKKQKKKN